jgi:hypothetical protein
MPWQSPCILLRSVMLKITSVNHDGRTTLILEGRLVDPWLAELERIWRESRQAGEAPNLVVDLKDVTAISERGQGLLEEMMATGTRFTCCRGVLTRHVVEGLCKAAQENSAKKDMKR